MQKADIKAGAENRFRELGAKQLELFPSGICWTMNEVQRKKLIILKSVNKEYIKNYNGKVMSFYKNA